MNTRTFFSILTVILQLAVVLPLAADTADTTPAGLQSGLERLDGDLRRMLLRVGDDAEQGLTTPRIAEEIRDLRQRLHRLESAIHGQGIAYLDGKGDALRRLLGNLERAADAGGHTAARPAHSRRDPGVLTLSNNRTSLNPANDFCAHATPISFGTVSGDLSGATNEGHASCGASYDSADLWFQVIAPEDGRISVDTFGSGYDTVVSVHRGCPGTTSNELTCNDDAYGLLSAVSFNATAGQSYWIRLSGVNHAAGPFQLHVGEGGELSGRLTELGSGTGIEGAEVNAWDATGYFAQTTTTQADGSYTHGGLKAGTYFLSTDAPAHLDELYDDMPCDVSCEPSDGAPTMVDSTSAVGGLDFVLQRAGSLSGTVVENDGGAPIEGLRVKLYSNTGSYQGDTYTDPAGDYALEGLTTGSYYVAVDTYLYAEEVYNNIACPGGTPYGCSATSGTAVAVTLGIDTPGVDFALDRLGMISGTVTGEAGGGPIANAYVEIHGDSTYWSTNTDNAGHYEVAGLATGTYYVVVSGYTIISELYQDIDCSSGCTPSTGTPINVMVNTTSTVDLVVDVLGRISGTVTSASTAAPIENVRIELWDSAGGYQDSAYTESDGSYAFVGLAADSYYITTDLSYYSPYFDQLYDDLPCPDSECDVTVGTPIAVALNIHATGVDLVLDHQGEIAGTITDLASGDPLYDVSVDLYDDLGNSVNYGYTNAAGQYLFSGLGDGTYYIRAGTYTHLTQLYDGISCVDGCDPTSGMPAITSTNMTVVADMALEKWGSIVGRVTDATNGSPISGYGVRAYDMSGSYAGYGDTNADGEYEIHALAAGTYFVLTDDYLPYLDELYDDIPCQGGCDPTTGVPLVVALNASATANFALERLGKISGTVTDIDGDPVGTSLQLWRADGSYQGSAYSHDLTGNYTTEGLPPGQYFVTTDSNLHLNKLYNGFLCHPSCDVTTGTAVAVAIDSSITGIDFVLDRLGEITGAITDAATGEPISGLQMELRNAGGGYEGYDYTDSEGVYRFVGLDPGNYFVATRSSDYINEVFDNLPCPTLSCDPTTGTPIPVSTNTTASGIDFTLDRLAAIVGTVIDEDSGLPINYANVTAYNALGQQVGFDSTNSEGHYQVLGLEPGIYFIAAQDYGYVGELHSGISCPSGPPVGCDPTKGTPAVVGGINDMVTVDFSLVSTYTPGYGIRGTVTDPSLQAIANITVDAWNAAGELVKSTVTDAYGNFYLHVTPGTYYLSTHNNLGFVDEVYPNIECPLGSAFEGACDSSLGSAVVVVDYDLYDLDFVLSSTVFSDGFESGSLTMWSSVVGGP